MKDINGKNKERERTVKIEKESVRKRERKIGEERKNIKCLCIEIKKERKEIKNSGKKKKKNIGVREGERGRDTED